MPTIEYLDYRVLDERGWDVEDDDLFEKAAAADLPEDRHGELDAYENEFVLTAAERQGLMWPFSCRSGSCANCACILKEGEMNMHDQVALGEEEMEERNVRLTCIGQVSSDTVRIIYNAKQLDYLQDRVVES